jgi:predicted MFS family arabinose efflux permease
MGLRAVRILQAAALVSSFDRAAIAPLLVPIAADFSRGVADVTVAATAYMLAYGVMQLFWAAGSDKFGRVPTMRFALVIAGTAGLASAAAPSLLLLVVARAVSGGAFAAAVPGALVYIGDTVPIRTRPRALADLATGIAAGFALGTLGAALIGEQFGWRLAFVLTGVLALVLAVLVTWLPEPERPPMTDMLRRLPEVVRHKGTQLILVLAFVEGSIVLGFLVFLPATLQLEGVSTARAGGVTAVYGVAVITTSAVVKRFTHRTAPHRLVATGGGLVVVAFAVLAVAHTPILVLVSAACLGGAWAQMHTALQAWATEVNPAARGLVVSAFAAALFSGSAVGTWLGGLLFAGGSLTVLFGSACAVAVVLTVVATTARARQPF